MKTFDENKAKIHLEQYPTDAIAAVEMVFIAGFSHDDLQGKIVIDLGIGTGRLAISALFLGATSAIGVEIDQDAIKGARDNALAFGMGTRIDLVLGDVHEIASLLNDRGHASRNRGYTVLMNPPFGVQEKGADVKFLEPAMHITGVDVIYSFHLMNDKNRSFLRKKIENNGWILSELHQTKMILPRLYEFHEKKRKEIVVDIYRILRPV